MSHDPRQRLAAEQQRLVVALTRGQSPPEGFDHRQIETAALSLANKRMRSVQKAAPALASALADRFDALFREYAASHSLAEPSPQADAIAFARFVSKRADFSPDERRKLLIARGLLGRRLGTAKVDGAWLIAIRVGGRVRVCTIGRVTSS